MELEIVNKAEGKMSDQAKGQKMNLSVDFVAIPGDGDAEGVAELKRDVEAAFKILTDDTQWTSSRIPEEEEKPGGQFVVC